MHTKLKPQRTDTKLKPQRTDGCRPPSSTLIGTLRNSDEVAFSWPALSAKCTKPKPLCSCEHVGDKLPPPLLLVLLLTQLQAGCPSGQQHRKIQDAPVSSDRGTHAPRQF